MISDRLKEPAALVYNGGAVAYASAVYLLSFAALFHELIWVNLLAVVALAHAMVIAAYMIHECGHNSVFKTTRDNARLGRVLSWLCGAAYGTYEDMRYKHFRHHVDNDDVVWFDYEQFFREHPLVLRVTRVLEWFYIPAHDLIMHGIMVFTSFIIPQRRDQRLRNVAVIVLRGGIFVNLIIWFPKVALLYAVAYMLMMTVLRFMDSVQHDYPYNLTLFDFERPPRKGNTEWEQEHTFSNPISAKFEKLNWLTLNFGFHNAHHADMSIPWYRLPEFHRRLFVDDDLFIPFTAQLRIFHENRVCRILDNHDESSPEGREFLEAAKLAKVSGGNAASFLTSF